MNTPIPWSGWESWVLGPAAKLVATCDSFEDAHFIARAVNSHQALVEALEASNKLLDAYIDTPEIPEMCAFAELRESIQAALKLAKA